jgi:hypothetical protein
MANEKNSATDFCPPRCCVWCKWRRRGQSADMSERRRHDAKLNALPVGEFRNELVTMAPGVIQRLATTRVQDGSLGFEDLGEDVRHDRLLEMEPAGKRWQYLLRFGIILPAPSWGLPRWGYEAASREHRLVASLILQHVIF